MDNQQKWYDLLPLYVEGQLPPSEAREMERRLANDVALHAAYEEWQLIAGAVRDDAAYWAAKLPPLSAQVKAQLSLSQSTQPNLAKPAEPTRVMQMPTQQMARPQSNDGFEPTEVSLGYRALSYNQNVTPVRRFPFSGLAAAAILLFVGAFIFYVATGLDGNDGSGQSNVSLSKGDDHTPTITPFFNGATALPTNTVIPTDTPSTEILPTITTIAPTRTPLPPPTDPPSDFDAGVQGFDASSTGLGGGGGNATTSSMTMASPVDANAPCTATALTEQPVTIYRAPFGVPIQRQIYAGEQWNVVTRTETDWYQVVSPFSPYERGWAYSYEISLSGNCSNIPEPSPTQATDSAAVAGCTASSVVAGTTFNVYSGPGVDYPLMNTIYNADVDAASDNGWVRVVVAIGSNGTTYGWVSQAEVNLSGNSCGSLPIISAQSITPMGTTTSPR